MIGDIPHPQIKTFSKYKAIFYISPILRTLPIKINVKMGRPSTISPNGLNMGVGSKGGEKKGEGRKKGREEKKKEGEKLENCYVIHTTASG